MAYTPIRRRRPILNQKRNIVLHDGYIAALICCTVLAVYFPAISAPFNPMDDPSLVNWLANIDRSAIFNTLFRPGDTYYRPVLMGSFLIDYYLWGALPSFMHLENVLLHVANSLLVWKIAAHLFRRQAGNAKLPAFLTAIIFALHPVNSEAVNWISGRSDLLAALFFLSSLLCLLISLEHNSKRFCLLSFLLIFPGVLSKETALFLIPAAPFIIAYYDNGKYTADSAMDHMIKRATHYLLFLVVPIIYLTGRSIFTGSNDPGMILFKEMITRRADNLQETLHIVLSGYGFYLKKSIYPFPLNFAITEISQTYFIAGIAGLLFVVYMIFRRDLLGAIGVAAISVLSSALLAIIVRPAWTPFAERYLYIPSALLTIVILSGVHSYLKERNFGINILYGLSAAVIIISSAALYSRNLLWQDNLALIRDTVNKSPDFPFIKSTLADILIEHGRFEEADQIIDSNYALPTLRNKEFLELKRAEKLVRNREYSEARRLLLSHINKESRLYVSFLKALVTVCQLYQETLAGQERLSIQKEMIRYLIELRDVTSDPFYDYRIGNAYMAIAMKNEAARHYYRAAAEAPDSAVYKMPAYKLARKLMQ